MTVADASDDFMRDAQSRNLKSSTLGSSRTTVARLRDFAETEGVAEISAIDIALLRE